jgi:glycosyltransferase involved in cell wall biosynthesis
VTGLMPHVRTRMHDQTHALRVAMVASRFPPLLGGIETHVDEVARRMAARGLEITVLTTDVNGKFLPIEDRDGLTVRRFRAGPRGTDLHASPSLVREVTHGQYDLVHVQGLHTLLPPMTLRACQRVGIPTVVSFHTGGHSSRVRTAIRESQWRALRPLLRKSNALIAVSAYEVDQFARRLRIDPHAIRLIRNGAEPLPVSDDSGGVVATGSPLISSVGRLERYKGHHRLVAAMPALLEIAPEARLVVVGRGSYEKQLRRLVARLRVERAVTFTSFAVEERAALGALLRASDIIALMSEYEANPVALMEALALGRKVVVADTSGLTELAASGLVTAVPLHAPPTELAEVLASVTAASGFDSPPLPTWDHCVDELLRVYAETVPTSG